MSKRAILLAIATCCTMILLGSLPARAAVLIVDMLGGPGTYTSPQTAFDAAASGDTVLIHSGTYVQLIPFLPIPLPYSVGGKSVTIAADPPGSGVVLGGLVVHSIGSNQVVVVRGIQVDYEFFNSSARPGLVVASSSGVVWLEDCRIVGDEGSAGGHQSTFAPPGISLSQSSLTLVRCSVSGGPGYPGDIFNPPGWGGPGIIADHSTLSIEDSDVNGGSGISSSMPSAGVGVELTASTCLASGSSIHGTCGACTMAVGVLADAASHLALLDASIVGGGGSAPISAPAGVVSTWPAQARSFELSSPVSAQQPMSLTATGLPGDHVWMFWSPLGANVHPGGFQGWLLLGPPLFGPLDLGPITNPSGQLTLSFAAPSLVPSTLTNATFLSQAMFANGAEVVASSGSALVLIQ